MNKISVKFKYSKFVSRNWIFIDNNLQSKIKNTRLLFAGCGVGSNIAILAARTGFKYMILADYDSVDISNLNRQPFNIKHVGKNKAEVTSSIIKLINPTINTLIIRDKINTQNIKTLVKKTDFIINTIDLTTDFYKLTDIAQRNKKYVLIPLNVGFGTVLLTLMPNGPHLMKILKGCLFDNELDFIINLFKIYKVRVPSYLSQNSEKIIYNIKKRRINPQLGIASNMTSALVITFIIKIIKREKNIPSFVFKDIYTNH